MVRAVALPLAQSHSAVLDNCAPQTPQLHLAFAASCPAIDMLMSCTLVSDQAGGTGHWHWHWACCHGEELTVQYHMQSRSYTIWFSSLTQPHNTRTSEERLRLD